MKTEIEVEEEEDTTYSTLPQDPNLEVNIDLTKEV